ncbi:hypothetical protein P153DRAFT_261112, partial [Dothidotthia symphoricarpi CBS 119687]
TNRITKHRSTTAATRRAPQHVPIGVILSNGNACDDIYECSISACAGRTFGRLAELKRHHQSKHEGLAGHKARFWCPVDGCESRSMADDGKAFPRKDKMMDHLAKVHA